MSDNTLPEAVQKRIFNEAETWTNILAETVGAVIPIDKVLIRGCYDQAVTNEATRSQPLVEFTSWIMKECKDDMPLFFRKAEQALSEYNKP